MSNPTRTQTPPIPTASPMPSSDPDTSSNPPSAPLDILEQIKAQVALQKLTPYTGGLTRDDISELVLFHWRFTNYLNQRSRVRSRPRKPRLARLVWDQFRQLNEDVNDEVFRRAYDGFEGGPRGGAAGAGVARPDFLAPRVDLSVQRNGARRRVALLAEERFGDLVEDIAGELPYRIPGVEGVLEVLRGREVTAVSGG
ncbi:uncharacterized protein K441DRAFT_12810 [Cenococcum geophilum 1.58]|uniref:uncharacterized protein n=1 Tax=Cenococcum geophilum 1.58 TaxID=794803 RepID=UPI0035901E6F|nr:hypothetical protein K441DRAFT_12810 [Cenococcum geophilum 1.58]